MKKDPLIIIRGLPGAGKSTFAKMLQKKLNESEKISSVIFETDDFFCDSLDRTHYMFDPGLLEIAHMWNIGNVFRFCRDYTCPCIVANSFTTNKEIQPYRNIARETKRLYFIVDIYDTGKKHTSIHDVPNYTLVNMEKRWEETNSTFRVYDESEFETVVDAIVKRIVDGRNK